MVKLLLSFWLRTSVLSVLTSSSDKWILDLDSVCVCSPCQDPVLDCSTFFLAVTSPRSALGYASDFIRLGLHHLRVLRSPGQASCGLFLGSCMFFSWSYLAWGRKTMVETVFSFCSIEVQIINMISPGQRFVLAKTVFVQVPCCICLHSRPQVFKDVSTLGHTWRVGAIFTLEGKQST